MHTFPLFHFHAMTCLLSLFMPLVDSLALYAFWHACLHVHAWVLLASVSSMIQHKWSYGNLIQTYICPSWTPPFACFPFCLFVCYLACLPSRLFSHILVPMFAMSITLICFMPFDMHFVSFPSITCLLASCLCLCMYTHGAMTLEARARSPKRKHVDKPSSCV